MVVNINHLKRSRYCVNISAIAITLQWTNIKCNRYTLKVAQWKMKGPGIIGLERTWLARLYDDKRDLARIFTNVYYLIVRYWIVRILYESYFSARILDKEALKATKRVEKAVEKLCHAVNMASIVEKWANSYKYVTFVKC